MKKQIVIGLLLLLLVGCGQYGKLYLPNQSAKQPVDKQSAKQPLDSSLPMHTS